MYIVHLFYSMCPVTSTDCSQECNVAYLALEALLVAIVTNYVAA